MTQPNVIRTQLEECFAVVFPSLSPDEIPSATMESVADWDSLASLTLVGVLEEMFQLQFAVEDLPELVSFSKIEEYLVSRSENLAA